MSQKRFDLLSVLTFVLAAAWLFGLGSLLAVYTGWRSLRRLNAHGELRGRTVTWAGIAVAAFGVVLGGLWLGLSLAA